MRALLYTLLLCLFCSHTLLAQDQKPKLVTWQDIAALPAPAAGMRVAYGTDSLQFGELRLPEGDGPFPVVVVVHGGCWLSQYNLQYMAHLSAALTAAGYATWNLEFRRVGDAGGGWPGTFLDVAQGTDHLKAMAKQYPLNLKQVVVLGHSAGGHLALWLAARKNLPRQSALYVRKPLKVKGVVSLAGIADLESYATAEGSCNAAVPKLMGGMPAQVPDRYAHASPMRLQPLKVRQYLVQGALDPIVPTEQATAYARSAKSKGDAAEVVLLPNAGHFDLVAPQSPAWPLVLKSVREVLRQK
ncbi:alpha/beta hydrolase family protein [Pontibacter virosus]|uniref:Prolyl oligopeptidase family protein n=1 Tax=Pontibacter virosus TaxID=1765052 RepID=A0A2U1ATG1_9BACT|nr:alpha/beta hydrolase [Pontibacter virosus]PVY39673.1 prolyl oligopeptidase family protein [Pontibacter virosus]